MNNSDWIWPVSMFLGMLAMYLIGRRDGGRSVVRRRFYKEKLRDLSKRNGWSPEKFLEQYGDK